MLSDAQTYLYILWGLIPQIRYVRQPLCKQTNKKNY